MIDTQNEILRYFTTHYVQFLYYIMYKFFTWPLLDYKRHLDEIKSIHFYSNQESPVFHPNPPTPSLFSFRTTKSLESKKKYRVFYKYRNSAFSLRPKDMKFSDS